MRSGEALVPMTPDKLHQIFAEAEPDFSAQICDKANFDDLDVHAIEIFRKKWISRTGNNQIEMLSAKQLLEDAELIIDSTITYAAPMSKARRLSPLPINRNLSSIPAAQRIPRGLFPLL